MTTKEDIRGWLEEGQEKGSTHVIVVVDTFDWGDYPVHVSPSEKVREVVAKYDDKDMQRVMEVYNLSMDLEEQLSEHLARNY